jgi:hypothetical protein
MIWIVAPAVAADCPDFDARLAASQAAMTAFQFSEADAALDGALTAVGCTPIDDPGRLSALLRTFGVRRFLAEDVTNAERFFASAKLLDAQTFESRVWSEQALRTWFRADAGQWGRGRLESSGPARSGWVNGRKSVLPRHAPAVPLVVRDGAGHAWVADVPVDGVATVAADRGSVRATPTPPGSATRPAGPATDTGWRFGFELGAPTAGRVEYHLGHRVLDGAGVRAGLNVALNTADGSVAPIVDAVVYADLRLAPAVQLEASVGVASGVAVQWDPDGPIHVNLGARAGWLGRGVVVVPDASVGVSW